MQPSCFVMPHICLVCVKFGPGSSFHCVLVSGQHVQAKEAFQFRSRHRIEDVHQGERGRPRVSYEIFDQVPGQRCLQWGCQHPRCLGEQRRLHWKILGLFPTISQAKLRFLPDRREPKDLLSQRHGGSSWDALRTAFLFLVFSDN